MDKSNYNRDVEYWNSFYEGNRAIQEQSNFATFVWDNYLRYTPGSLIELGCGNGRDSAYFISKSLSVTGIDASKTAIDELSYKYRGLNGVKFICEDFVNYTDKSKYAHCYSRFSIHAISEKQETKLFERLGEILEPNALFFIEVRSINDEIFGKGELVEEDAYFYQGHYRRFIRLERLITKMIKNGFTIDFAAERRGFAPYGLDDPMIIRVVGRKS